MSTRWYKVLADLWGNRGRTLIVALALAVGVYTVASVLNTRELMVREFERDRAAAAIADAVLYTVPFDETFAERVARIPGVTAAEGRHVLRARIYAADGSWQRVNVTAIPDYHLMDVDAVAGMAGVWPPPEGTVLMEHLSLPFLGAELGDTLTIETTSGVSEPVAVSGVVHDPQVLAPDIMGSVYVYVTPETMVRLGETDRFTELRLRAAPGATEAEVEAMVARVEEQVEDSGRPVLATAIPEPIIRPIIDTLMLLITAFGVVVLVLSTFLVVNAISALIVQQIPQIGVMKLVGASRGQVMSLYLVMTMVYGLIAILVGVPLAVVSARFFMDEIIKDLLNVVPDSYAVPLPLLAVEVAIGLVLPLFAGLVPVLRGTRLTTFEALNDVGLQGGSTRRGLVEPLLGHLQQVGLIRRPLVLAVRNTLRHKGRLLQTLLVLIFGSALFIAVLTVRTSVDETVTGFLRYHEYDVSVGLARPYRTAELAHEARRVPGVVATEGWSLAGGTRIRPDGSESGQLRIVAVPPDTAFMSPQPTAGRWLQPGDSATVVVNSDVVKDEPDIAVGDEIVLDFAGRETSWQVAGIVPTSAQGPSVYMPDAHYAYVTRTPGQATALMVATSGHDAPTQAAVESALFDHFDAAGYDVASTDTSRRIEDQNERFFIIIVMFLIFMAVLLAAVGGLGLATTMSINILERIREIGVLRAVGASNNAVRRIVLAEGIVIGIVSWLVGTVLSVPFGRAMSAQVGLALIDIPLTFRYSVGAAVVWFFAIILIAVVASLGPARNAVRLTVREVLAYE